MYGQRTVTAGSCLARFVLWGTLLASGPTHAADRTSEPSVLVTLPSTTLTLVTLPTLTLPTLPTTTLTAPSLPSTTLTLPPLPTTTLTLPITTTTIAGPRSDPATTTTTTTVPDTATCGALDCDDGNPCTQDLCAPVAGCLHVPLTGPACDDGDRCTADDRCVAGLCAGTRVGCTPPPCPGGCPDDGFSCTDEVCTARGCLHVPVDARCVPPGACTNAVCAPGSAGADAAGCLAGTPQADGAPCAEDTDACTADVCRGGACTHEPPVDSTACAPVQGVFRQTIALEAITRDLLANVGAANSGSADSLTAHLETIAESLAAAERALAGDGTTSGALRPAVVSAIPASMRARIAFTDVLRTPREVAAFLDDVRQAQEEAAIPRAVGRTLRRGGRQLLGGIESLKADLRQLQRGTTTARARRHRHRTGHSGGGGASPKWAWR